MANIGRVGKAFLVGSGVVYPIQRGILKVASNVNSVNIKKTTKKKSPSRKSLK
ncbi:hypothetical protein [Halobacteriovorax sp. HLS]|uniref:hypothetical protein n=1 Tax=Halobacteriovorax sp. HLS TaxID=2234000 RepID=UPI0013E31535|nr:hypothetical protein [Halobacteriovorax sp. HLS]